MREHRCSSVDWSPSPVVALTAISDHSQVAESSKVAAAREDGSLEVWIVASGSVGWHCQLSIHGDPNSRISSLVWCRADSNGLSSGRLFSSSLDGTISAWDLFDLKQVVLESIGVSIWQMAVAPTNNPSVEGNTQRTENGHVSEKSDDDEGSESEDDYDTNNVHEKPQAEYRRIAAACDDGCVKIYHISNLNKLTYYRSLPRVSGRALSVTWSQDAQRIFSGSSDGMIRCWDANHCHEVYRITAGHGGLGSGSELCVWSLLSLRSGALVSGDSTGNVQFWDSEHGTLLQAHSNHQGDVNALAASPSHNRVFSAGADGKVVLYNLSDSAKDLKSSSAAYQKWDYIGYVRPHTHDVRALTVATPISREDCNTDETNPSRIVKREIRKLHGKKKESGKAYEKWASSGVPMLISAGDDAKLFAYSVQEFTKFSPYDICPAPQRVPIQMVHTTAFKQISLLLVQGVCSLDIMRINVSNDSTATKPLVQVKSKGARIICSAMSNSGSLFAYSDQISPRLFELKRSEFAKNPWSVSRRPLPKLPCAHSMVFSSDCSQLITAAHDRIYVVDVGSMEVVHTYTPYREEHMGISPPSEPVITKMHASIDGQWLAAINCYSDIYIFDLKTQRQHWFISRPNGGGAIAAASFHPKNDNVIVISTTSNQIIAYDVEARQEGEWSMWHSYVLPEGFKEFPGEVIGLSFSPSPSTSSLIFYSSRARYMIDFGMHKQDNATGISSNGKLSNKQEGIVVNGGPKLGNVTRKRRLDEYESESTTTGIKNFKHPVLFLGHLSKNSILVVEKPWMKVIKGLDTKPVHRHVFGT